MTSMETTKQRGVGIAECTMWGEQVTRQVGAIVYNSSQKPLSTIIELDQIPAIKYYQQP